MTFPQTALSKKHQIGTDFFTLNMKIPEDSYPNKSGGEKGLIASIILNATTDLKALGPDGPKLRERAVLFFQSKGSAEGPYFTFHDCCQILDMDPEIIREELTNRGLLPSRQP